MNFSFAKYIIHQSKGEGMKKIVALILFGSQFLYAASIKEDIRLLSSEILELVEVENQPRKLARVRKQLESVKSLLEGTGTRPGRRDRGHNGGLSCIARDNDNRAPWVMGYRDPVTLKLEKMPNSLFQDKEKCNLSLTQTKETMGHSFVCISRDNDGRSPFVIGEYDEDGGYVKHNKFLTLESCMKSMSRSRLGRGVFSYCGSRDNDDRTPYTLYILSVISGEVVEEGYYSKVEDCFSNN